MHFGVETAWFIFHKNHDLAIKVLDQFSLATEDHASEYGMHMRGLNNTLPHAPGPDFFNALKLRYGKLDWRTVHTLTLAIQSSDFNRHAALLSHGVTRPPQTTNIDIWPILQEWIKSDIINGYPDAVAATLMIHANRYFQKKKYDKTIEIVEYILKSKAAGNIQENNAASLDALQLGARTIITREEYGDLRPYLERYGGAPKVNKASSP